MNDSSNHKQSLGTQRLLGTQLAPSQMQEDGAFTTEEMDSVEHLSKLGNLEVASSSKPPEDNAVQLPF